MYNRLLGLEGNKWATKCFLKASCVILMPDLSIFQDAVTKASRNADLQQFLPNAVAFLLDLSSMEQREMEVFAGWYHDMMDLAVFGTEDDPIIIDE